MCRMGARPGGDWPRRVLALNHRSPELHRAFSLIPGLRNEFQNRGEWP
nr:MAG TPA: hypothetical protein [Caudoviricetes sp.]